MADLRAYVANCLIGGHTITQNANSWSRNIVKFECAGREFIFTQHENVVTNYRQFKGQFCETSEVVVKNVQPDDVGKILEVLDRICWLLSFASLSSVICYGHDYPDGSAFGHRKSVIGIANFFRPTINIRDGGTIKSFVEQAYAGYTQNEKPRKLNVVIDYLVQAEHPNQPTELKLILAFILLENLKDTFARSKSIPHIKGYFRKQPRPNGQKYGFEELLHMMLREVGMRKGLKRIVKLRNEIIHSGLSRKPHRWQWIMYENIHDIIREYILRFIDYHGTYLTYSSASRVEVTV